MKQFFLFILLVLTGLPALAQQPQAPLFRDPIYDGAADPVLVYNHAENNWWMLYTARRANQDAQAVSYCYGTNIGIASTDDNGRTWVYRGELDLDFEQGKNTFWAPDVIYHNGLYHMFVVYIRGTRSHWGGNATIHHYTSKNLWDWKHLGPIQLSSDRVIDATVIRKKDGTFRIWYKDETRGSITMMSDSKDLKKWTNSDEPAIGGGAHEGPKVFEWKGYYWMLTDEWQGMRVYRSSDLDNWEKQGLILDEPGKRPEDSPTGAHGDVVVTGDKAYVFYFTHPGRESHGQAPHDANDNIPYALRRSSIQVAELEFANGTIVCDRDKPFDFSLPTQGK